MDGRPFVFHAAGECGTIALPGLRVAWTLRGLWPQLGPPLEAVLERSGLRLRAKIGPLPAFRFAPAPKLLVRLLLRP